MRSILYVSLLVVIIAFAQPVFGQSTAFTYQGSLKNSGVNANGSYDFEFALFDTLTGGTQLGSTLAKSNVAVADGSFSVSLDFGSQFPGATRFLEIRVRPTGQPGITTLGPRQTIASSPYSVKSLSADTATNAANAANADNATNAATASNALSLGGVAANQYVLTVDARLSDARTPTAGSANYIQNGSTPQATSNFNISGTGSANIVNAATQYNLGGQRMLSVSGPYNTGTPITASNTFLGESAGVNTVPAATINDPNGKFNSFMGALAGVANTTGANNSFVGGLAGNANTTGSQNSFFGVDAGKVNTTGSNNTFSGGFAGFRNTTQHDNTFLGYFAGATNGLNDMTGVANLNTFVGSQSGNSNTTGGVNSFVGASAGQNNTTGFSNSFVGVNAGLSSTTGSRNSFFGGLAGQSNVTGSDNTIIGNNANLSVGNLTNATAVGANAIVSTSNSMVLGGISGINGATADTNVGIGTTTPAERLHVVGNGLFSGNFTLAGVSAPGVSPAGQGRFYFDTATNRLKVSENGSAYVNLLATGGVSGSGSTGTLPIWSSGTALLNSNIFQSGNNVGIGSGAGSADTRLQIFGDSSTVNVETSEMIRLHRPAVSGIKNTNSAGIAVGAFETGILGRARMDFRLSGTPTNSNQFGIIPDVTVMSLLANGNVGIGTTSPTYKLQVNGGLFANSATFAGTQTDTLVLTNLSATGPGSSLCAIGSNNIVGLCSSSSLRYKKNLSSFTLGLDVIRKLKPISFEWRRDGSSDYGLGAEDVERIDPKLVFYKEGKLEGVRYERLPVVLVNAVKEQQAQIEKQDNKIKSLETQVTLLKELVCRSRRAAAICRK